MPPRNRSQTGQDRDPDHTKSGNAKSGNAKPVHGRRAARQATARNSVRVTLPIVGTVELPPTQDLTYIGGLGLLTVVGLLEWPIAATLGVGHLLAADRRNKVVHDFGDALEEA